MFWNIFLKLAPFTFNVELEKHYATAGCEKFKPSAENLSKKLEFRLVLKSIFTKKLSCVFKKYNYGGKMKTGLGKAKTISTRP